MDSIASASSSSSNNSNPDFTTEGLPLEYVEFELKNAKVGRNASCTLTLDGTHTLSLSLSLFLHPS